MTQFEGLTRREARELMSHYGENTISSGGRRSIANMLIGQFRDALIMILLAATLISLVMGEISQALTVSAIVAINALLGFFQEFRTERTLEKLANLASPTATVIRDGCAVQLPASQVVPGDLAQIRAGDRVPADGEILGCTSPAFDEAMLTGESLTVEKNVGDTVYMGTTTVRGSAYIRVKKTGSATEMGKIASLIGGIRQDATPLQKRLSQLSKYIGIGCIAICAVVAAAGIMRGEDISQMLMTAISLAVAAVPEGLPAIVTVCLCLSVGKMVKRNALIRRLHAVETLGCATVICSDKTGTLTQNRMTVTQAITHNPQRLARIADICNNATAPKRGKPHGEATEIALKIYARDSGCMADGAVRVWENPFDSAKKYMSVLCKLPSGAYELCVKGAPEVVLEKCTHMADASGTTALDTRRRHKILSQVNHMCEDALRVLALAWRSAADDGDTAEERLIFAGLVGLSDPPRREAYQAVKRCKRAGIRPIMITGDGVATARAIARELGISQDGQVISGAELEHMDDARLRERVCDVCVFARVTPTHKLRIVNALKACGQVVAMTGDGVNDAPALKQADIGVAMGITGTDVSKEAADVVLLDDNFATLVTAVEQGRVIYSNIRKFIRYLLSCNIGEVVTMFFAMLLGLPVPLLPIQILLVNLITDSLPAIALGLEGADADIMQRPPRAPDESVFSHGLAGRIVLRGVLIGVSCLAAFALVLHRSGSIDHARSAALLALVATQLIHVFECKSESLPLYRIRIFSNPMLCLAVAVSAGALAVCMAGGFLSAVFHVAKLSTAQVLETLGICLAVPIISCIFAKKGKRAK